MSDGKVTFKKFPIKFKTPPPKDRMVEGDEWDALFEDVRVMEYAALKQMSDDAAD